MGIGDALRRRRLDQQLQQVTVAAEIGVSQASYSAWERDESVPKLEHLPAIAEFLEMTEAEVVRAIFAPNGSVDRVEQLETAVAELRRRVADMERRLKKQLHQHQVPAAAGRRTDGR